MQVDLVYLGTGKIRHVLLWLLLLLRSIRWLRVLLINAFFGSFKPFDMFSRVCNVFLEDCSGQDDLAFFGAALLAIVRRLGDCLDQVVAVEVHRWKLNSWLFSVGRVEWLFLNLVILTDTRYGQVELLVEVFLWVIVLKGAIDLDSFAAIRSGFTPLRVLIQGSFLLGQLFLLLGFRNILFVLHLFLVVY